VNLRQFLQTVRMYKAAFLATFLTVLALGLAWLLLSPLQYVSRAQLLVSLNGTSTANAYQNDNVVASRINSYVTLLTSDTVSQRVVDKLGLKMSAGELAKKVSAVQVPPSTAIIDIAVSDRSPEQARRIAGTVADEFVAYTQALESPTGVDAQKVQTSVVSPASEPHSRLPERIAIGGLIAVLALLAGAVAAWIRAATDRVVRTTAQAGAAAGVPLLAVAPPGLAETVDGLEPYRRVRAALNTKGPVVAVASTDGNADGRAVAANLQRATAFAGDSCVLVDATGEDGAESVSGSDYMTLPDLWSGDVAAHAAWPAWQSLDHLRNDYQRVVIAAPPVTASPGASVISEHSDVAVLVVKLGSSRRSDIRRAAANLTGVGAAVAGVVAVTS
jgi:capsular polysaccharide biosynthesis protein